MQKQEWGELEFRQFIREQIDKHFYATAGLLTLRAYYFSDMKGWRYDKLYSVAVDEIRLYKQKLMMEAN